jgi:hypothetical protein
MGSDRKMDSKTDSKLGAKAHARTFSPTSVRICSLPPHDIINISQRKRLRDCRLALRRRVVHFLYYDSETVKEKNDLVATRIRGAPLGRL